MIDDSYPVGANGLADVVELGADSAAIRYTLSDRDADGVPDYLDLDSDNDGLSDLIEVGGNDVDADGVIDEFTDSNADGLDDGLALLPLPVADSDADLVADFRDLDSDNDGLPDLLETAGSSADTDGDGMIDEFADADGDGRDDAYALAPLDFIDTDADGLADHLDRDSDNDGVSDLIEAGGADADGDGRVDSMGDTDNDGIPDEVDVDITGGLDNDEDGIDDSADIDYLNDVDSDDDGIADSRDPDADGDGFAESDDMPQLGAALPDTDGNGIPDFQQSTTDLIETGLNGGGCTLSRAASVPDPTLPLTVLLAAGWLGWRRFGRKASAVFAGRQS